MRDFWLNASQADIRQARRELTGLMADERARQRDEAGLQARIAEFEAYARQALASDRADLAGEIAEKIVDLERHLARERSENARFSHEIARLRDLLSRASGRLNDALDRRMQHRLDLLEAAIELQEGDRLAMKMQEAGIGPTATHRQQAKEILARIRPGHHYRPPSSPLPEVDQ
ncbi:MAG: PspA/IM30 family protein [Proteobacteria bacterium]|nr:PspA/IM30 family protein [Pseudomonadota bacterium]MDA1298644.1 PspA/IM30 family protein [Pseudomonadota bacterium]